MKSIRSELPALAQGFSKAPAGFSRSSFGRRVMLEIGVGSCPAGTSKALLHQRCPKLRSVEIDGDVADSARHGSKPIQNLAFPGLRVGMVDLLDDKTSEFLGEAQRPRIVAGAGLRMMTSRLDW